VYIDVAVHIRVVSGVVFQCWSSIKTGEITYGWVYSEDVSSVSRQRRIWICELHSPCYIKLTIRLFCRHRKKWCFSPSGKNLRALVIGLLQWRPARVRAPTAKG